MRLATAVLLWVAMAVTAPAQSGPVALNADLEALVEAWSFHRALDDRIGAPCRAGQAIPRHLCAVALDDMALVPLDEAEVARTIAIKGFNAAQSNEALFNSVVGMFAAQYIVYRHQHADAPDDAVRGIAFDGLSALYDFLVPELAKSGDPQVAELSVWMAAELTDEANRRAVDVSRPTKRLTNLGNALNRFFDRTHDVSALNAARDIHEFVLTHVAGGADPVSEARTRLNLGNTYTRMGAVQGIDAGRIWNGRAVDTYAPGIDRLAQETVSNQAEANRLLTGMMAQMAQSLLSSPGDEYLNHRRAVATVEYARTAFADRLSDQRAVELFLAEVGTRIQIMDRFALPHQKSAQLDLAFALFDKESHDAIARRPVPDTGLGVHMSGASLYAIRGGLSGDPADCAQAKARLYEADKHIQGNTAVNADRLIYTVEAYGECRLEVQPELARLPRLDAQRISAKVLELQPLIFDKAEEALTADERAAVWLMRAGGNRCEAAETMTRNTKDDQRLRFPEFWELTAVAHLCRDLPLDRFVKDVRDWLTEREQTRAESRSGYALIARADLRAITDLALVLLEAGRFGDAVWLLDFANRSRMTPGLAQARDRMAAAGPGGQKAISDDIETWMTFDNPGDPLRSFKAAEFTGGNIRLVSEVAGARQSLGRAPPTPTVTQVLQGINTATADRHVAWFLLGGNASAWLIASPNGHAPTFRFVPVDITRAEVQTLLGKDYRTSSGLSSDTFSGARNKAAILGPEMADASRDDQLRALEESVELWQTALDETSSAIADRAVTPLYSALMSEEPSAEDPPLLTLVVRNALADLPLHVIDVGEAAASCGDTLIACFEVTWAGHAGSVHASVRTPLETALIPTFWGFDTPEPSHLSLAAYGSILSNGGFAVTNRPDDILDTLEEGPVGLWVLHGTFDPDDPGASAFDLQVGSELTGTTLLSKAPKITDRRLQVLIGCQSALFDTRIQPTEQTGLAEPFHQIGIDAVVVSSWNAETVMSRIFTHQLFENLKAGFSPAAAYRRTILTLKSATVRDLAEILAPSGAKTLDSETYDFIVKLANRYKDAPPMAELTRLGAFRLVEG